MLAAFFVGDVLTADYTDGRPLVALTQANKTTDWLWIGPSLSSWQMEVSASSCTLVQRGPGFRYLFRMNQTEPDMLPVFSSHDEEVNFWHRMQCTLEVPNPATGHYSWTDDEMLRALLDEKIDFFASNAGFGLAHSSYTAFVVTEPRAKQRLRKAALKLIVDRLPAPTT